VIDCTCGTVTAGFWNSHVHLMSAALQGAESAPSAQLAEGMRAMLTSYGVVHAVDIGSRLANTLALRRRVEQGEIPGPSILTAGSGFAPEGGSPYYILPLRLPELRDEAQTAALVNGELDGGADLVKLFTGSWARRDAIVVMPVDLVARRPGRPPAKQGRDRPSVQQRGARAAIESGVDILAHTFPSELDRRPWDRALPGMMRERGMALVPTPSCGHTSYAVGCRSPSSTLCSAMAGRSSVRLPNRRSGSVRHRRGLHDRLRSDRRIRLHAAGGARTRASSPPSRRRRPRDSGRRAHRAARRRARRRRGGARRLSGRGHPRARRVRATLRSGQVIYRRTP
jgi:hypothetical protein